MKGFTQAGHTGVVRTARVPSGRNTWCWGARPNLVVALESICAYVIWIVLATFLALLGLAQVGIVWLAETCFDVLRDLDAAFRRRVYGCPGDSLNEKDAAVLSRKSAPLLGSILAQNGARNRWHIQRRSTKRWSPA